MFDSFEDLVLEKEMLKILKQLQGNTAADENETDQQSEQKKDYQIVKSVERENDKQINVNQQQKGIVEKVSTAVGDEIITWEENYISLMKECGLDLPEEAEYEIESDDGEQKPNLFVKKSEEQHNKDLKQYNHLEKNDDQQGSEDDNEEEDQKQKQMLDDLHEQEENIMTAEQQKEYFKELRCKYINNEEKAVVNSTQCNTDVSSKTPSVVGIETPSALVTEALFNGPTATPSLLAEEIKISNVQEQVNQISDKKQTNEDRNNFPRSLLPQDHQPLTREMYDEWKKQKKMLKKAHSKLNQVNGQVQDDEGEESEEDQIQNQDEEVEQTQGRELGQDEEEQQEEDDYDENVDETTQDEQHATLTEVKREYIQTNKWNCKEYKVTYSNEDVYEGEVDDQTSLKDGWGAYFYSNGEKYEGFFQDDIIHGYGRYWFLGGHKYEGDWKSGMKHGIGQLDFASGDKYIGFFEEDNFHGAGEYFYKNGDKFDGTFVNGKKNGAGKFLGSNGRKIIGEWIDDQLQHF